MLTELAICFIIAKDFHGGIEVAAGHKPSTRAANAAYLFKHLHYATPEPLTLVVKGKTSAKLQNFSLKIEGDVREKKTKLSLLPTFRLFSR